MNSGASETSDGPPPYQVAGRDRFDSWRERPHPDWLELEVTVWISGLYWNPWQEPSTQVSPSGERDEVRIAVVPDTNVGVSYIVTARARLVTLIEVADLQ
jgi:hypothetical protein